MSQGFVQVCVHVDFHRWLTERAKARGKSKAAELNEIRQLVQQVEGEQPATVASNSAAVRND